MSKTNNFGDVFPPRNLGQGDPWGRHQEIRVIGLERSIEGVSQEFRNEQRVLSARAELQADQMKKLARQQDLLDEQQRELAFQQGLLQSQQEALENQHELLQFQQSQLQSQQDQLEDVVNAIPIVVSQADSANGFALPSGTRNVISMTVPVPDGKTKASVFAFGQAFFFSDNVAQANIANWRVQISGNNGPFGHNVPLNMDGKSVSVSHARDVSLGSLVTSVTIRLQAIVGQAHPTYPENNANLFATIAFS